jgi:hypothetical protein
MYCAEAVGALAAKDARAAAARMREWMVNFMVVSPLGAALITAYTLKCAAR